MKEYIFLVNESIGYIYNMIHESDLFIINKKN